MKNLLAVGLGVIQFVFHIVGLMNALLKPSVPMSQANSMHAVSLSWERSPVSGRDAARVPQKTWIRSKV